MRYNIKFITVITVAFILHFSCIAQENSNAPTYYMQYQFSGNVLNSTDSVYNIIYHISVNEIINVKKVHVQIGTTEGGHQILSQVINATGVSQTFPDGLSYNKTGNKIELGLGNRCPNQQFISVKLEDNQGNIIEPEFLLNN
ncbi:MAG: hypothetical protein A2275_17195 [Bacteroidetes bacterium RIFOXYA12_FULL_35_11]|nr:MAG: hypothetical protein A2X01_06560 [Bacteroidetes bacterium GWF2_35_48]OFY79743.1 MAG: hypothetical protein A2275_17195 [Bacteroidetes bacterium RIFOXYA12_FULL_35_11]OFY96248.1 MAG: hypothetical protein A2491_09860 [Bacteroidetes bacterium RIFOXYC12_FULL_35_7]HBX49684.1 hypothetical protein [Bacteroidales bacterium]